MDENGELDPEEFGILIETLEADSNIQLTFEELGIPLKALQLASLWMREPGKDGNVDVLKLLKMVESENEPTTTDDMAALAFCLYKCQERLQVTLLQIEDNLNQLHAKLCARMKMSGV